MRKHAGKLIIVGILLAAAAAGWTGFQLFQGIGEVATSPNPTPSKLADVIYKSGWGFIPMAAGFLMFLLGGIGWLLGYDEEE